MVEKCLDCPNPNKCSIKAQNRGGKTPREQKKKEKKNIKQKKGTERRKEQEKKKENQKGKMKKRDVLVEKKRLKKAGTRGWMLAKILTLS